MTELPKALDAKKFFFSTVVFLIATDIAILLNIPFLRQIFGFLFLTILLGLLILQVLKLNKIGLTEKFVLSIGLSISFLMFFGLLINNSLFSIGYEKPLSTISLLLSFNIAFITLAIIGYKINKKQTFPLPNLNLTTSEKAFLIVPVMFPALSIFGMHVMNTTDNNIVLMFMLFLIPIYVIFVCFFNHKFPKRLYPVVIFLISISLLLIWILRFPHIYGGDVHFEYYLFRTTLNNLHWGIVGYTTLDACLSISLLPAIYQSILNVNAQEYLFRGIYVSICSFTPLVIYVTSKKYIGELYAFLASFFFISEPIFLMAAVKARTDLAIFFVALAVMVFFTDKIDPLKRRILFIVFMLSTVVSHYSTTYIFFFTILFTWLALEIFSKREIIFKKKITLTIVLLFFAFIFFWYSQVTEAAFRHGVYFIEDTFSNLNNFFVEESRNPVITSLYAPEIENPIMGRVCFIVTWSTFIVKHKKPDFLKTKFEPEYLIMALACAGLLVITVALPYISTGYGMRRLYSMMLVILSVCFVIGGMTLSHFFFFYNKKRKPVLKEKNNGSEVRAYLIILVILIPYFLFQMGAIQQIFGVHVSTICLNSCGETYDRDYLHDQECCAAKWLIMKGEKDSQIYSTDMFGRQGLISQGKISPNRINRHSFSMREKLGGYIYLSYNNVVNGKLVARRGTGVYETCNMSEYSDMLIEKNKIYNNAGSEIYK
jgi:uncharacterized membrane protein